MTSCLSDGNLWQMFVLGNSEHLLLCQVAQADAVLQCDHGPSRAFPKFESYGMLETAASVGLKVKDAIVRFHGIGRLVPANFSFRLNYAACTRPSRAIMSTNAMARSAC